MVKLNNRGFTLIELLVSIAIIGIIGVPLLSMFTTSMRNNIDSGSKTKTVAVAQSAMEWFKSHGKKSDDTTVPSIKNLEGIIADISGNSNINTSATLYVFYKDGTDFSSSLKNYDDSSNKKENDDFNIMKSRAQSLGKDYDYMIKVVLSVMEEHSVIKIDISVWDKFYEKSQINLVSLRSNW